MEPLTIIWESLQKNWTPDIGSCSKYDIRIAHFSGHVAAD